MSNKLIYSDAIKYKNQLQQAMEVFWEYVEGVEL